MNDDILELELEGEYIGSAVSPEVDITETSNDVTVTITDYRGEHSYTIEKTDGAIADAEAAASAANAAASYATSTADAAAAQAVSIANTAAASAVSTATTAANNANAKAELADTAATNANTKAALADSKATLADTAASNANDKATLANTAASTANTAAANADAKATAAQEAATAATGAASTATTAASNADAKAALANTAASNANTKAALADTAATNANTKAGLADAAATAANTAAAAANAAREAIQGDLAAKADADAYAPLLTAGIAESLLASDEQTDTFARRISDHDGSVGVKALLGNTVRWNQLVRADGIITSGTGVTNSGNGVYTIGNVTQAAYIRLFDDLAPHAGHKFYIALNPSAAPAANITIWFETTSYAFSTAFTNSNYSPRIVTLPANAGTSVTAVSVADYEITIKPQAFDLTAMFGAGNEPATVTEFERMFPESYYPYDAGSLLSVNISGINNREIPVSTYFPDGMRGAGTAHDALYRDHADTVIGAVDLGTLEWAYSNINSVPGFQSPSFIGKPQINSQPGNIKTSIYQTVSAADLYTNTGDTNIISLNNSGTLQIRNTAYTDAASFKAAMSGVMLYYELATPTTTPIDPPLNMDYLTQQGGVESIAIPEGEQSAPVTLVYVQGYDADGVADKALSVIATVEGAKASTNYAVGSYFVHDGKLYKASSVIATGETITPGTNCTQTTVMAEILALA